VSVQNVQKVRPLPTHVVISAALLGAIVSGTAINFLIGFIAKSPTTLPGQWGRIQGVIQAVTMNGVRTVVAAAILLLPVVWFGVDLRFRFAELWRYILLACVTMAIPHALIFSGMGVYGATATNVAFIETAVLGLVIVYLFAEGRSIGIVSMISAFLALVGLAVLLQVGVGAATVGDGLVLASAFVTAFGLILAEKLDVRAHYTLATGGPATGVLISSEKAKWALRKTFVSCLIAGLGTLLVVAIVNPALKMPGPPVLLPPASAWPWVVALALVGNCAFWYSFFLLIELKQLVLAAASVAAIPLMTELTNHLFFKPVIKTPTQWIGAITVLVSLAVLIKVQLRPLREPQKMDNLAA
jgi:drug/metabolite transporter (DMT)-like permease